VETVPAEFRGTSPVISFNPHYLLDGLNAAAIDAPARSAEAPRTGNRRAQPGGRIRIEFTSPAKPALHHLGGRPGASASEPDAGAGAAVREDPGAVAGEPDAGAGAAGQEDRRGGGRADAARARSARRTRGGSGEPMPVRGTSPRSATLWSRLRVRPGRDSASSARCSPARRRCSPAPLAGPVAPLLARPSAGHPCRRTAVRSGRARTGGEARPRRSPATSRMMAQLAGKREQPERWQPGEDQQQTIATMTSTGGTAASEPVARDRIPIAATAGARGLRQRRWRRRVRQILGQLAFSSRSVVAASGRAEALVELGPGSVGLRVVLAQPLSGRVAFASPTRRSGPDAICSSCAPANSPMLIARRYISIDQQQAQWRQSGPTTFVFPAGCNHACRVASYW